MWHWINDHWTALSDIGLAWVAPVLVAFLASSFFRGSIYRGGKADATLAAVRMDKDRTEEKKKAHFAVEPP